MTVSQINDELLKLVKNERKLTHEILRFIADFYKFQGYLKLGYSSIVQYLTKHLGYSDDQAYRRWKAAKLLLQVPEVGDQISNGFLNLSQVALAQKSFEVAAKESKQEVSLKLKHTVLADLAKKSNFESQKILAEQMGIKPKTEDRIKPQSNQTVRLEVQLSITQFEKFNRIKSILSHKFPEQKAGDILEAVFDVFLLKKQGKSPEIQSKGRELKLAPTLMESSVISQPNPENNLESNLDNNPVMNREAEITQSFLEARMTSISGVKKRADGNGKGNGKGKHISRYVPVAVKQTIFARAKFQCEFRDSEGRRCESDYQLELDHVCPVALGGRSEVGNLRLLCKSHNRVAAKDLGIGFETTSYFQS